MPDGATILDAELRVRVLDTTGPVTGLELAPIIDGEGGLFGPGPWDEGEENAFDPFVGEPNTLGGASWSHKDYAFETWNVPGAEAGPALDSVGLPLFPNGAFVEFQSPELTADLAARHAVAADHLGYRIRPTFLNPTVELDQAVLIGSADSSNHLNRPLLTVYYVEGVADPTGGQLATGTVPFIGEGEDFRWIYDDDGDDVLFTSVGGRCAELATSEIQLQSVPYEYSFLGDPDLHRPRLLHVADRVRGDRDGGGRPGDLLPESRSDRPR